MAPRAVFWDMDGTLIDSEPLHDEALAVVLDSLGLKPPADLHQRILGQSAHAVYTMFATEFGVDLPFETWIARKYAHYLAEAPRLKPREGAMEIFRALDDAGAAQAIVSNSDRLVVDANLRAVGLQRSGFRSISRNDVRFGKPHPEPFLRAAWLAEVNPSECFVMEDSFTGASAGIAAGMKTVFWPQVLPATGPDGALATRTAADVRRTLGLD